MKPAKRKKIMAMLANPASTENEKEICRKLLKAHPEDKPKHYKPVAFPPPSNSPFETPEQAWKRHNVSPFHESIEDAFRRQAATARQSAAYNQHTGQDAARRSDAAAARGQASFTNGLFGGAFGGFGQAQHAPKPGYTQGDFERAQANIKAQRKEQEAKVDKLLKKKKSFLYKLSKAIRGDSDAKNESD